MALAAVVLSVITHFTTSFEVYDGMSFIDVFTWKVWIENTWLFVLQVAAIAMIVTAAFTLLYSVGRLFTGKRTAIDWLAPLVWLIAAALFIVSAYMWDDGVSKIGMTGWIVAALSVPAFIIGIIPGAKTERKPAASVSGEAK